MRLFYDMYHMHNRRNGIQVDKNAKVTKAILYLEIRRILAILLGIYPNVYFKMGCAIEPDKIGIPCFTRVCKSL